MTNQANDGEENADDYHNKSSIQVDEDFSIFIKSLVNTKNQLESRLLNNLRTLKRAGSSNTSLKNRSSKLFSKLERRLREKNLTFK